jgi:hypothetical protein
MWSGFSIGITGFCDDVMAGQNDIIHSNVVRSNALAVPAEFHNIE